MWRKYRGIMIRNLRWVSIIGVRPQTPALAGEAAEKNWTAVNVRKGPGQYKLQSCCGAGADPKTSQPAPRWQIKLADEVSKTCRLISGRS
jgi:hypothetical protein